MTYPCMVNAKHWKEYLFLARHLTCHTKMLQTNDRAITFVEVNLINFTFPSSPLPSTRSSFAPPSLSFCISTQFRLKSKYWLFLLSEEKFWIRALASKLRRHDVDTMVSVYPLNEIKKSATQNDRHKKSKLTTWKWNAHYPGRKTCGKSHFERQIQQQQRQRKPMRAHTAPCWRMLSFSFPHSSGRWGVSTQLIFLMVFPRSIYPSLNLSLSPFLSPYACMIVGCGWCLSPMHCF